MSAVPIERYQAKKLLASERGQQVLSSAIEIIVVITSLIGTWLTASKYVRTQAILTLIAALFLASPVTNAAAADITVRPADKSGRIFVDVSGDIAVGDEKTFGEKTANLDADHTYVSLVSDGGSSIAGGSMGDIIRFRGMNTYVPPNATCASICAFIWLAGSAKFVANSSHIGVHGAYNAHTLQPSNEMNILLAVYLAQLGYNYDDVLWMLLPPPGNMHWLTPETAKEHHIYWAELSPTREQSPLYDYLPPAPSPPVVSAPRSRPVAQYTADHLPRRQGAADCRRERSRAVDGSHRPHPAVGREVPDPRQLAGQGRQRDPDEEGSLKMETQLDHTYLRPGIISRAAAVGLAATGVGAGVLLACWGLSFFWHVDDAVVRRLEAIAKQTAGLSDVVRDEIGTLSLRTTESIDALGGKLDALDAINQRVTVTRSFQDGSGQPERTGTGDVIRREVTVFNSVSHEGGDVTTGWQYKDGASDGQPMRQYCYFLTGKNGVATKIDLASNGQRLFNENVTRVPRLEEALAKCQWWTS